MLFARVSVIWDLNPDIGSWKYNMELVFTRVAAVTPNLALADVDRNSEVIVNKICSLESKGVDIIVFPELCLTGYTCGDLFEQQFLLDACLQSLANIVEATKSCSSISLVGLPFSFEGRLFNCAAVVGHGRIYGLVPKSEIPNCAEFYEKRWFSTGANMRNFNVPIGEHLNIPFGIDILFKSDLNDWKLGVEICEDLWSVIPPSSLQAVNGANIIANLSASNDLVGKSDYRRELVSQQSARCVAAYVYCSSGVGESSTDLVFSGHRMIAENGVIMAEADDFTSSEDCIIFDIDHQMLKFERHKNTELKSTVPNAGTRIINIGSSQRTTARNTVRRDSRLPFVPSDRAHRQRVCDQIFNIQSAGLARRLTHMGCPVPVIGVSGGLDSTLALLVTAKALENLGRPTSEICALTMPGFGTSERTLKNAKDLIEGIGIPFKSISIIDAVRQHFKDIGHDEGNHDVVYENAQARERTKILMNIANQKNGVVIGTGDLSEAALGWCTFNGDHMSMYHVNIGIPKTLVQYVIDCCINMQQFQNISETLSSIIATPISPELLPISESGQQLQETEVTLGPYEVHDFILYHFCRYGRSPSDIFVRAKLAFEGVFSEGSLLNYLETFYKRFFSQQFKRSSMPDGPKVGSISLSPRGDWRMPSDASSTLWLNELQALKTRINETS